MTLPLTIERTIHFRRGRCSRRQMQMGQVPARPALEPGRVPRVARLMALALRFDRLLRDGEIAGYSELAELGRVSRARISQIMNLLNLAPDIQEQILFLPRTVHGRDPIILRQLQPIASLSAWRRQRCLWQDLTRQRLHGGPPWTSPQTLRP